MTIKAMKEARFKAAQESGKDKPLIIEGYANKFLTDAYNERMDPESAILSRFEQNPILLFNHDMNYVVGKVLSVEKRKDGVFVRAMISSSSHEKVAYVRELVADGTLCTFSVRFANEQVVDDPDVQGGKLIKNWELQEVSVVSIPAQPDSTFSLAQAKSLGEARQMVLKAKGAMVAKVAAEKISELVDGGEKKEELLEKLGEQSGLEPADLSEVLAGNVTPVADSVISALASVLGIDEAELKEHNAHDVEAQKKMEMEKKEVESEQKPEDKPEEKAEEQAPLSQAVQECVSEKIPVLIAEGKPEDEAVAIAISMCSKEKGCSDFKPTSEMMAKWLADCDKVKQADQEHTAKETVPVGGEPVATMNDNAMMMLLKSQLEMLGSISIKLDKLADIMLAQQEQEVIEEQSEEKSEATEQEEKVEPEVEEQMKSILERYEARLKALLS